MIVAFLGWVDDTFLDAVVTGPGVLPVHVGRSHILVVVFAIFFEADVLDVGRVIVMVEMIRFDVGSKFFVVDVKVAVGVVLLLDSVVTTVVLMSVVVSENGFVSVELGVD